MRYDSYSRFIKSQMYKDCVVNEMEGKSIKSSNDSKINGNKSITLNSNLARRLSTSNFSKIANSNKLFSAEQNTANESNKKDKKKGTILPWNKGIHINLFEFIS
jgi:regulator of G-protein signaling